MVIGLFGKEAAACAHAAVAAKEASRAAQMRRRLKVIGDVS
jgi:hypothetical protein